MTRLAFLICLLAAASLAGAQDLLFNGRRELGAIGRFGQDLGPAPPVATAALIAGGRYAVGHDDVVDRRTGESIPLGPGTVVAHDRARPRIYMWRDDGVWMVDVALRVSIPVLAGPTTGLSGCLHADSADRLVCAFARGSGASEIVTVQDGVARVVLSTHLVDLNWVLPPDGQRLYFERCTTPAAFCPVRDLAMLDLTTGHLTTLDISTAFTGVGHLIWDEFSDRLISLGTDSQVFTRHLVRLGVARVGGRQRDLVVSPHTGRVYLQVMDYYYGIPAYEMLTAFDSVTYQVQAIGPRIPYDEGRLVLWTAPGAPRDVHARVNGHEVTLAWTNVGGASHFVLDAGLGPGWSDISIFLGSEPHVTFSNVPPGVYYVRLRGGNELGGGRPSREVVISVPATNH
jgi:hypothetical protein